MTTIKLTWLGHGTTEKSEEVTFSFEKRSQLNMMCSDEVKNLYNYLRLHGVKVARDGNYILEIVEEN